MDFLNWLPEPERSQKLKQLKGQTAVRFPATYFSRVPKNQHLAWVNLTSMDKEGYVVKTAPDNLIDGLIATMVEYNQDAWKMKL